MMAGRATWSQDTPPQPLTLAQVSWSFHAVVGAVVQEVLERSGHPVMLRTGRHEDMYALLGQGNIDLMALAWLPDGHAGYWLRHGANAREVAQLYTGARFFWAVPDYVPEAEVASIADLARPSVLERMTNPIQSIGANTFTTALTQAALRAYGLDTVGYRFRSSTTADWVGAYESALRDRRWFVFPTWEPQYLNRQGRLRALRDPGNVLGGSNRASLVAPAARLAALPGRTRDVLARLELSVSAVTEMDWAVNVDKLTAREAAQSWMRTNRDRVASWLQA